MRRFSNVLYLFCISVFSLIIVNACNNEKKLEPIASLTKNPKIDNLKLPEGFQADHLFGPSENGDGSWVSMTFDNKGRDVEFRV